MADFKDRFKELRQEKKLSQKEVGLNLGYCESTISLYEAGEREPKKITDLKRIADYFNVSLDYLIGRTDNKTVFLQEETINGHNIKIAATIENFPKGISRDEMSEYAEIAAAIETLKLSNQDLNLLLRLKEIGITFQDIEEYKKFKEANMTSSDIDLFKSIRKHVMKKC
jgi:transcriptional regulator with XRE-family HTH domain